MSPIKFLFKVKRRLFSYFCFFLFQFPRVLKYRFISAGKYQGYPIRHQPVLIEGLGLVSFSSGVHMGVQTSPAYYSGYIYINARTEKSVISFGDNVWVNNGCSFISEGEGIEIGSETLIGAFCDFYDSDFHDLEPGRRMSGNPKTGKVVIGRNVFIGSNVKVLKGVCIGDDAVIANGSVVVKDIPARSIAAGVPAKVIRIL